MSAIAEPAALTSAISVWRAGRAISLVLYARLREEGFDVPSLERFYRRRSEVASPVVTPTSPASDNFNPSRR